jgi:hypothetical protein
MRQIAHEVLMTMHGEFPDVENDTYRRTWRALPRQFSANANQKGPADGRALELIGFPASTGRGGLSHCL